MSEWVNEWLGTLSVQKYGASLEQASKSVKGFYPENIRNRHVRLTFSLSFVLDAMLQKMGALRGKGQKSRKSRSLEVKKNSVANQNSAWRWEKEVWRENRTLGPSPSFTQMLQKPFQIYEALNLRGSFLSETCSLDHTGRDMLKTEACHHAGITVTCTHMEPVLWALPAFSPASAPADARPGHTLKGKCTFPGHSEGMLLICLYLRIS